MKPIILIGLLGITTIACTETPNTEIPEYKIPVLKNTQITLDGQRDEAAWDNALKITKFINPWHKNVNPKTSVELFYDGYSLYFFFDATDQEVVTVDNYSGEMDICDEDRVELFFSKDISLSSYYGFEMDPKGRTMDYQCSFPRKFNYEWSARDGIEIETRNTPTGYTVEGRIAKELLEFMTGGENPFYWGAYRAEYSKDKNGKLIDRWQCLRDPKTKEPDFHLPASFSKVYLGEN